MAPKNEPSSDLENRVAVLAHDLGQVLIAHERLNDAFKTYRVFTLADDTPEAIEAASKDLDHHRVGTDLQSLETQLTRTKEAIIRSEAQALADSITWDENDQAVISESDLVKMLIRVITDERRL